MGKINDVANKMNNHYYPNRRVQKTKKEAFEIRKGHRIRDLASLTFDPNFHDKYKLDKRYRNMQLGARVTIAALVAALGIGVGASVYNSSSRDNKNSSLEYSSELLSKTAVLEEYKETLKECILHGETDNLTVEYIDSIHDDGGQRICVKDDSDNLIYKYDTTFSTDPIITNKEIKELITNMINLYSNHDISQENLEAYNDYLNDFDSSKFRLNGSHIINTEKEKNSENER